MLEETQEECVAIAYVAGARTPDVAAGEAFTPPMGPPPSEQVTMLSLLLSLLLLQLLLLTRAPLPSQYLTACHVAQREHWSMHGQAILIATCAAGGVEGGVEPHWEWHHPGATALTLAGEDDAAAPVAAPVASPVADSCTVVFPFLQRCSWR